MQIRLVLLLLGTGLTAHPLVQAATLEERLKQAILPQIQSGQNVGAVIGILSSGKPTFYSFGETKRGTGVTPNEDTIYEIGSITKTFTGLLLAIAIQDKLVNLDEPVSDLVPGLKGQASGQLLLRELVTHTSGLPRLPCNMTSHDPQDPYADYAEADLLIGLSDKNWATTACKVVQHPAPFSYSNWGMALLGYALARKQNTTYPELLESKIVKPLALPDTTIALSADQRSRLAQPYDAQGAETHLWDRKIFLGNGAIRASARGLMQYLLANTNPDATPLLRDALRLAHPSIYQDSSNWIGFAWMHFSGSVDSPFWHNGATGGFRSDLVGSEKTQGGFLWLTNSGNDLQCVAEAIADAPCSLH